MAFTLPTERVDRIKFFTILGITGLIVGWLIIYFVSTASFKGPTKAPDTAGARIAREINSKLLAEGAFADVAVVVESEKPLKFTVNGAVHKSDEIPLLEQKLKEWHPEAQYDLKVESFRK